ncbi:MAG TPA: hypothetical protein VE076_01810 [Nitrososphaeraceae archaeon]|nr:hypothetical protein [Nitrososphaeraceae archaeon]
MLIAGIAFAGDRGISKVEVSNDGGNSWKTARPAVTVYLGPMDCRFG